MVVLHIRRMPRVYGNRHTDGSEEMLQRVYQKDRTERLQRNGIRYHRTIERSKHENHIDGIRRASRQIHIDYSKDDTQREFTGSQVWRNVADRRGRTVH